MGWKLDENNVLFRLRKTAWMRNKLCWSGKEEEAKELVNQLPLCTLPHETQKHFSCRKCSTILFSATELVPHDVGLGFFGNVVDADKYCDSHFLQPMWWMKSVINENAGLLLCPQCQNNLGKFDWNELSCSCKAPVLPAFQVFKSNINND